MIHVEASAQVRQLFKTHFLQTCDNADEFGYKSKNEELSALRKNPSSHALHIVALEHARQPSIDALHLLQACGDARVFGYQPIPHPSWSTHEVVEEFLALRKNPLVYFQIFCIFSSNIRQCYLQFFLKLMFEIHTDDISKTMKKNYTG